MDILIGRLKLMSRIIVRPRAQNALDGSSCGSGIGPQKKGIAVFKTSQECLVSGRRVIITSTKITALEREEEELRMQRWLRRITRHREPIPFSMLDTERETPLKFF